MSEHVVESGPLGPIFLSAGAPDPRRHPAYFQTARPFRIREAVTQLARVVLPHTLLVFGGHPAISPLILTVAHQIGALDRVEIHQSDFFRNSIPPESMGFRKLIWTPEVRHDREGSLEAMRRRMIGGHRFSAAIFIGGMDGVEKERALFRTLQPAAPDYLVASTGGATRVLFDRGEGPKDPRVRGKLEQELVYGYLFQSLLGLVP
ncbi:hypothetical protein [Sorangium sp. So ce854]|uniref:SLOG domain-containing protein n=1 Tax=Sorangium sp. So ce854 TaxID=3133322 RepID=UPI003F63CD2B